MPGPAPKDPEKRQRRNAEVPMTELAGDPVPAPKLPRAITARWQPETRRWWKVWVSSPQATLFAATDWERLQQLAPLVDQYWREPKASLMAEIRQGESLLGATPIDRQRLRWKIRHPEVEEAEAPARRRRDPRLRVVKDA
jgi:hypothetical protein